MFKRSFRSNDRVEKAVKLKKSYRDPAKLSKLQRSFDQSSPVAGYVAGARCDGKRSMRVEADRSANRTLTSPIVTFMVGKEGRLFAAHEDVLSLSPFFAVACRGQFLEPESKRIDLPDEEPEIFSCVLEYLYVSPTLRTHLCYAPEHLLTVSCCAEGRLLPPLAAQQAPRLLGTRGCSEHPKPRKQRWSRKRRGYNLHLQRGRIPFEGHGHILCGGKVRT